jgi:drug/metabolite transporter (DMT)-like permease
LLRNPRWIAATLGNAVGYGLQAAALGVGSVVVVQPILVTSLLFALPLSARLAHQRLPSTAVVSALLLSGPLSVVVILGDGNRGLDRASYQGWLIVTIVAVPLVAGCLIFAHAKSGAARASVLAIAVGLLGGALAVLTKSVVDAGSGGVVHLLGTGETYALIVVGLGGTYLQQLSFQAGALHTSLPIMTVLEPTVAAVLGLTLLHEQLQTGDLRVILLAAAALTMALATVALARVHAIASTRVSEVLFRPPSSVAAQAL